MKILVSNDDGVHAPGLKILAEHLKKIGKTYVVAPLEEKSTTGHSLTIHKPLRVEKLENGFYSVSGSPADSVYIGMRQVLKGKPDLVVSGINRGGNLGQDLYYSGTVSAAREACILGLPSIAISLNFDPRKLKEKSKLHFETAAKMLVVFLKKYPLKSLPQHTLLNINVPNLPYRQIKGFKVTTQGFRYYSGTVLSRMDHRGRPYYWIGGQYRGFQNKVGTDCHAVHHGLVSVTPVRLDCTDTTYFNGLQRMIE